MKKYILFIIATILMVSCSDYKYPENATVSERSGAPVDSSPRYLLDKLTFGGDTHVLEWNKEISEKLNTYYTMTSEPILYNFYLGRDVYRILIVEKGKESLILSVNKDDNRAWVVSKRINEQVSQNADTTSMAPLLLASTFDNYTKDMTDDQWAKFSSLWQAVDFYHLGNNEVDKNLENFFLIEAHQKGKYWCVYRSLDDAPLKEVGSYVKSLTRF